MTQPQRRSTWVPWLGVATALMCALAGGAVWSVLALRSGRELAWFAFVCALVIAWALRANGFAARPLGGVLAALFTALACIYAQCLLAVGDVAQALGFSLRDTLLRIGTELALSIMRGRISPWDTLTWVAAMAVAAWLVLRKGKPPAATSP
jgi:hypothetical protein